jgi:hypothetical protein
VLLACAAVVAAVITARASFLGSDATGAWQSAVRQETKRSSLALLSIDYVYRTEGSSAFAIATEQMRADQARAMASAQPSLAAGLESEAQVHDGVVTALLPSSELASDPRYALPGGGYDLQRRLADNRNQTPSDLEIDPDLVMAQGDAASARTIRAMGTTIPVALAFLFGALAQAFKRRRTPFLALGWVSLLTGVFLVVAIEVVG